MRRFGGQVSLTVAVRRAPAVCRSLHSGPPTAPPTVAASASWPVASPSPSPPELPTSEDYRALLLDLLLYRKETLEPLLIALRRERAELDVKMAQLEAHVRELRGIREELRRFAETKADEERKKLHDAVMKTAKPPQPGLENQEPSRKQGLDSDEIVL